ncbi:MAG: DUF4912 domain-containing protein [Pirellulaceae bacterium]|nr:DUF4912 domain-containing protein [Pirellulaceae bacterium]
MAAKSKQPASKHGGQKVTARPAAKPVAKQAPKKVPAKPGKIAAKAPNVIAKSQPAADRSKSPASGQRPGSPVQVKKAGLQVKRDGAVVKQTSSAKVPAKIASPQPTGTSPKVLKKIRQMQLQREASKDIGYRPRMVQPPGANDPVWEKEPTVDRIGLFVRDPYWLHVAWDITRGAVDRAQAALAEQWHSARPVIRLMRLDESGVSSTAETIQAEIEINGGVRNWYIPWTGEVASFRVQVGYVAGNRRFHMIAVSNVVRTVAANSAEAVDQHWTNLGAEGEKIYAQSGGYNSELDTGEMKYMLEQRLNRSLGAPALAKLAIAADGPYRQRAGFHFDMEVELVFFGATAPDSYLTINDEPVTLRPDGTFVVRLPFPDRRQVIPAVAVARDGSHHRTIVVAVERNTKTMEPMEQEQDTGD